MTLKPDTTRTLHMLAIMAVIVLASGSLTLALGGDNPAEEITSQFAEEQIRGDGCCANQAADGGEPGALCRGRNSRQSAHAMRHRQGRGHGMRRGMDATSGPSAL